MRLIIPRVSGRVCPGRGKGLALGGCPYKEPCNGRLTEDGEDIAMAKGGVVPGVFFLVAGSLRTRLFGGQPT